MHSTSKLRWCQRHLPGILRHSEATTAALRGPASIAARHCFLIRSGGCSTHLGHALFFFQRNSPDGPVNYLRASLEMELWFQEDSDCVYWRQSCNFTNKAAVDKCVLTKEGTMLMNGYGSFPVLLLPGGPGGSGIRARSWWLSCERPCETLGTNTAAMGHRWQSEAPKWETPAPLMAIMSIPCPPNMSYMK